MSRAGAPVWRAPVPATPIRDLTRWHLHFRCGGCRRYTVLMVEPLAEKYGGDMRISEVLQKPRCDGFRGQMRCHARPAEVSLVLVSNYGKSARKLREIVVVGRGAR